MDSLRECYRHFLVHLNCSTREIAGTQELHKFTHDPACFCMLLGRDGSEGLDLSFVTRECFSKLRPITLTRPTHAPLCFFTDIFFLEEIWDKSLAEQTVARAWRMGAKGSVEVETIIAKDSVEETMKAYEAGQLTDILDPSQDYSSGKQKDQQQRKAHVLLKSLRFITDFHHLPKAGPTNQNHQRRAPPSEAITLPPKNKRRKVAFVDVEKATC